MFLLKSKHFSAANMKFAWNSTKLAKNSADPTEYAKRQPLTKR